MYKSFVENRFSTTIKCVRCDNASEIIFGNFKTFLDECGIEIQNGPPYTPQANGISERMGRSLQECGRAIRITAKLPESTWFYCIQYAAFLKNLLPAATNNGVIPPPYLSWNNGEFPIDLSLLPVFGQRVVVRRPKQHLKKGEDPGQAGKYIGYDPRSKAYKVLLDHGRVGTYHTISFDPASTAFVSSFLHQLKANGEEADKQLEFKDNDLLFVEPSVSAPVAPSVSAPVAPAVAPSPPVAAGSNASAPSQDVSVSSPASSSLPDAKQPAEPRRSARQWAPTTRLLEELANQPVDSAFTIQNSEDSFPSEFLFMTQVVEISPSEAIRDVDWRAAMQRELDSHKAAKSFEFVNDDAVTDAKPIPCKWIFALKGSGQQQKYKARLVLRGDLDDATDQPTFSPTAAHSTIRLVLAIAAMRRFSFATADVTSAYLNAPLPTPIFAKAPITPDGSPTKFIRVLKSIYGLKQSGLNWYQHLCSTLASLAFEKSIPDPCLFSRSKGSQALLIIVVDDILVVSSDPVAVLDELRAKFTMGHIGSSKDYVGLCFDKQKGGVRIHQKAYALSILRDYRMENCTAVDTPIVQRLEPSSSPCSEAITQMRKAVGSLGFLCVTRPDLSFTVQQLASIAYKADQKHLQALKRVLRYIKGTIDSGLFYPYAGTHELKVYVDSDFNAQSHIDSKCNFGFIFMLAGCSISWNSKRTPTIMTSSAEAELHAAFIAAKMNEYLRQLLSSIGIKVGPTIVLEDNQAVTQAVRKGPTSSSKLRTANMKVHYLKEQVDLQQIQLQKIESSSNTADLFTKPLGAADFIKLRSRLGMSFDATNKGEC
jgi:hypothetical protein